MCFFIILLATKVTTVFVIYCASQLHVFNGGFDAQQMTSAVEHYISQKHTSYIEINFYSSSSLECYSYSRCRLPKATKC